MITGVHTLVYAQDHRRRGLLPRRAPAAVHRHGRRLADLPDRAERARQPSELVGARGRTGGTEQAFDLSLVCDDLAATWRS